MEIFSILIVATSDNIPVVTLCWVLKDTIGEKLCEVYMGFLCGISTTARESKIITKQKLQ